MQMRGSILLRITFEKDCHRILEWVFYETLKCIRSNTRIDRRMLSSYSLILTTANIVQSHFKYIDVNIPITKKDNWFSVRKVIRPKKKHLLLSQTPANQQKNVENLKNPSISPAQSYNCWPINDFTQASICFTPLYRRLIFIRTSYCRWSAHLNHFQISCFGVMIRLDEMRGICLNFVLFFPPQNHNFATNSMEKYRQESTNHEKATLQTTSQHHRMDW